ncbi:MAG: hypothetical protein L6311_06425 [Cellulomonas sp.]|nr:hypothetical protein [Cellulomonas sp.]
MTAAAVLALVSVAGVATAASADVVAPPDAGQGFAQWERQLAARSGASRLPSSTLSSGATATTRIAGASRSITSTAATGQITVGEATTALQGASKFGMLAKGATAAVTAATGFDIGYNGTTFVMGQVFGIRSDGFVCDMSQLLGDSSCVPVLAPQVDPDADVTSVPEGWSAIDAGHARANTYCHGATCVQFTMDSVYADHVVVKATTISWSAAEQWYSGFIYVARQSTVDQWTDYDYMRWAYVSDYTGFNVARAAGGVTYIVAAASGASEANPVVAVKAIDVAWFAKGTQFYKPAVSGSVERWWHTEWQCEGGAVQSAESAHFLESDPEFPLMPQATCNGASVSHVTVSEYGAGVDAVPVYSWDMPQQLKDWQQAYPECGDASCVLELQRVDATTGSRLACFDSPSLCADWLTDPAKTDDYRCVYGTHDVALDECNVYGPTFKAPGPDGSVQYGDPQDGTGTSAPVAPLPAPDDGCPPPFTWTSMFNPWWYYKGGLCVVQQAFLPSAPLQTSKVTAAWNGSALGQVGGVVSNLGAGFAAIGGGECGVITDSEPVPLLGWHLVVDTCSWPWNAAAPLKRIVGIAFLLGAVVIGVRTVLRIIRADVVVDGGEK